MVKPILLEVDEAYGCRFGSRDIGNGIARLDPAVMNSLSLLENDLVAINGIRTTIARCRPFLPPEMDINRIRIDKITRMNAGVNVGARVSVRKVEAKIASKLIVKVERNIPLEVKEEAESIIRRKLIELERPVIVGDRIAVRFWKVHGCYIFCSVMRTDPANVPLVLGRTTAIDIEPQDSLLELGRYRCDWEGDPLQLLKYHVIPGFED